MMKCFGRLVGWIALSAVAITAGAQQRTLWQIGKFNYSSQEFKAEGVDYTSPKSDVVYTIGKSHAKNWIGFQPGSANAMTGGREHPFRIDFTLQQAPRGLYELRVGMLYETPRLSALKLSVNGHSGIFYFHPHLDFHAGDWAGTFVPQTSYEKKTIAIPTRWLQRGANHFVLTAVDFPATPQESKGSIAPGQSGIVYDAIALAQNPGERYRYGAVSARVVPTIFYKRSTAGLEEMVDVYPELHEGANVHGTVTIAIGGKKYRHALAAGGEFGEAHLRFAVREWKGTAAATVTVNGHRFQEKLKAAKKWTLDVVPGEHLDIGFTDYAPKVAELQSESVDGVLDILKKQPDFRWTLDGSWVAQQYLADRSEARRKKFLAAVRAGQIVVPAQYANQLTGTASLEGLIRGLHYSHSLAKKYDLPVGAANITDVPCAVERRWSTAGVSPARELVRSTR